MIAALDRPPLVRLAPSGVERVAVAVAAGALALAGVAIVGGAQGAVGVVLFPALVLLSSIDVRHHLLPNAIVLPAAALVTVVVAAAEPGALLEHVVAGVAVGGFLFAFAAIFSGSLGMGDAKLGLLLGVALGSAAPTAIFCALFAVFVAAGWILLRHGLTARTKLIPFGPFLSLGAALAFFLG